MKAPSRGNLNTGFSTLEIMMALFIMVIVLAGAASANFAAEYWVITSETSNEALYKAKTTLENYRAIAREDFYRATTSPFTRDEDASCAGGGLCYFIQSAASDLSSCSKYVEARVDWQVDRYPTTTVALFTNLTNVPEAVAVGGDCLLSAPAGDWTGIAASSTVDALSGNQTGLDALNGNAYITMDQSPWLLVKSAGSPSFSGCSGCNGPYNGLDAARDPSTGRTYAYVAATTTSQFQIVDVTDTTNPSLIASRPLAGVTPGANSQGWKIAYYGQKAYIATRYIIGSTPEFHVFDVGNPYSPVELGAKDIDTSPYDIVVRDQMFGGSLRRFAYLATTHDGREVMILDVTDPALIPAPIVLDLPDTPCSLANKPDATALFLLGNTLWVGREHSASCSALPDLYAVDVSNPLAPAIVSQISVGSTILGLRVSGGKAYIETSSWANAPGTGLLDIDGDSMYAVRPSAGTTGVKVWSIDPSAIGGLSSYSPLGHSLQIFNSP